LLGILFWGWFAFWYLRELRDWSGGTGLKTLSYRQQTLSHRQQTLSHRQQTLSHRERTLNHKLQALSHREQTLSHGQQTLNYSERTASEGGPYESGHYNSSPDETRGVGDRRRRGKRAQRRIAKSGSRSTR